MCKPFIYAGFTKNAADPGFLARQDGARQGRFEGYWLGVSI